MPLSKCVSNALNLNIGFSYVMYSSKLAACHPTAKGRLVDNVEIPGFDHVPRRIFGEFSTPPQALRWKETMARCPGTYRTDQSNRMIEE